MGKTHSHQSKSQKQRAGKLARREAKRAAHASAAEKLIDLGGPAPQLDIPGYSLPARYRDIADADKPLLRLIGTDQDEKDDLEQQLHANEQELADQEEKFEAAFDAMCEQGVLNLEALEQKREAGLKQIVTAMSNAATAAIELPAYPLTAAQSQTQAYHGKLIGDYSEGAASNLQQKLLGGPAVVKAPEIDVLDGAYDMAYSWPAMTEEHRERQKRINILTKGRYSKAWTDDRTVLGKPVPETPPTKAELRQGMLNARHFRKCCRAIGHAARHLQPMIGIDVSFIWLHTAEYARINDVARWEQIKSRIGRWEHATRMQHRLTKSRQETPIHEKGRENVRKRIQDAQMQVDACGPAEPQSNIIQELYSFVMGKNRHKGSVLYVESKTTSWNFSQYWLTLQKQFKEDVHAFMTQSDRTPEEKKAGTRKAMQTYTAAEVLAIMACIADSHKEAA